jgi:hypothetical protein
MIRAQTETISSADLLRDIRHVLEVVAPDPLAKWMRSQGYYPERGDRLYLPKVMALHLGPHMPLYVAINEHLPQPVLVRNPAAIPLEFVERG